MKRQFYSTLFVLFAFSATSKAQTDTTFWFAPPQISTVSSTYDGEPVNKPINIYFAAKMLRQRLPLRSRQLIRECLHKQCLCLPTVSRL